MGDKYLVEKLSACMYVLVGLTRLNGTDKKKALSNKTFAILVIGLVILTIVSHYAPVPDALPSTFFLIMQIIGILKAYESAGQSVDHGVVWILFTVFAGILAYGALSRYEDTHPEFVENLMVNEELSGED
jgi:hypothetical protein